MKHFLLAANDAFDPDEKRIPAFEVVRDWLGRSAWPVYANTKNRNAFEVGARIVFYVGGKRKNAQTFVGTGTISSIRPATFREIAEAEKALAPKPVKILQFTDLQYFHRPVPVRPLLTQLAMFEKAQSRWGVALVGGSRRITESDFAKIVAAAEAPNDNA